MMVVIRHRANTVLSPQEKRARGLDRSIVLVAPRNPAHRHEANPARIPRAYILA